MNDSCEVPKSMVASIVTRKKMLVLVLVAMVTGVFALGIGKMRTEVILSELFPYGHPYLELMERFDRIFGGGGTAVVIAVNVKEGDIFNGKTLAKIKDMTNEIELWDEVYRKLTISIASYASKTVQAVAGGEIRSGTLMYPDVPKTEADISALRKNIFSSSEYDGTLVSEDGSATLLATVFRENISYERVHEILADLVARYSDDNTSLHIIGFPVLMGWIYSFKYQMYLVFAISVVLMVLILWVIFRNMVGIVAPMVMLAICTLLGLGFTGWTQINFSPLLYVLAFLVGARMLSNSVQITHRYLEEFQVVGDKRIATYNTIAAMWKPNAAAVLTDAVGFSVLAVAKIVLMQHLAVIMSFWMLTIGLSGVLVPVICSLVPINRAGIRIRETSRGGWLGRLNSAVAAFSVGRGKRFVGCTAVAILVVGVWQITALKVGDPSPGSSILWPDHAYNRDQGLINEKFKRSSETFQLFFEGEPGSVYDPQVLKTFEDFGEHMIRELPDIYKSSDSIINAVAAINYIYRDGDPARRQMPIDEFELTSIMGILRSAIGDVGLSLYIDAPIERTHLTLFFSDHTSDNIIRIRDAAYAFFENHPRKTARGEFLLAGGGIGMEIALNEEMKRAHAMMDTIVLLAIFVMCALAFRSLVAGMMLVVPLILSNLIAFTYMAVADVGLTTNTLPCSAVGVGVGVDFAIYLYSRCMEEYREDGNYKDMVLTAVRTAGKGIVFTGVTLILPLLLWYYISALKFQAQMGFFLSMLLFTNMLAAMTLHPLLICIVKPKFMRRRVAR